MKAWWQGLEPREQRMLLLGSLALLGMLLYVLLLEKLPAEREQAQQSLLASQKVFYRLEAIAEQVKMARKNPLHKKSPLKGSLLGLVDRSTRQAGIRQQVKRLTPDGKDQVRLWFDSVSFDQSMNWLEKLYQQGVQVEQISVNPLSQAGLVRLSVTLVR
ncbi:MAG: type II secretion system protein M [gamma proteobacterium symbiont of Bathyaustriella thionipta]|nr:type II secretion system protein M [gamma proteobacterium symbiont of Bathyaustriella thionipta]